MNRTKTRWLFSFFVIALIFLMQERSLPPVDGSTQLYASVCQDDLRKVFLKAINSADQSIYLVMYSLSDEKVIGALNQKAKEGIKITVIHDTSTPQKGFEKLKGVEKFPIAISGLMHQKILIIDDAKIWIGSANFTKHSLRLHDNLVMGMRSEALSTTIQKEERKREFTIEDQKLEFWTLPRDKKEGLTRLLQLIDTAQKTVRVAMYTWTHPLLTEAIVRAHKRGVDVELILDRGQAKGVGKKAIESLQEAGVAIWLSSGHKLLHHKCMIVDDTILVNGSANWTRAAFSRNRDCFFILHDLKPEQQKKLETMWRRTRILSNKKTTLVYFQTPSDLIAA